MNPLLVILLAGTGILLLSGARVANAVTQSSIKLLGIDSVKSEGGEIIIAASVGIDNPTSKKLFVTQPNIKLLYNDSEIVSSKPSAKVVTIVPNERTNLKLDLRMAFTALPILTVAILNKSQSGQVVVIQTSTTINGISVKDSKTYKISELVKLFKN